MQHSLIDPAKLHVFGVSRRHQKMRKSVINDYANLWGTSRSFLPNYLRRRKGPAVPKRDLQKMHLKSLYNFQAHEDVRGRTWTHVDARGPHVINFPHLLLLQHNITSQGTQWLTLGLSQNSEQWWQGICSENDFLSNAENLSSTYAFTFTSYHVYRRSHLHYITYVFVNIYNILTLDGHRRMQTFKGNSI